MQIADNMHEGGAVYEVEQDEKVESVKKILKGKTAPQPAAGA